RRHPPPRATTEFGTANPPVPRLLGAVGRQPRSGVGFLRRLDSDPWRRDQGVQILIADRRTRALRAVRFWLAVPDPGRPHTICPVVRARAGGASHGPGTTAPSRQRATRRG